MIRWQDRKYFELQNAVLLYSCGEWHKDFALFTQRSKIK